MAQKNKKKYIRPWAYISIRFKLAFLVALMLVALLMVLYLSLHQSSTIMQLTYAQESDYYNINSFQTSLLAADGAVESFLHSPDDKEEYLQTWELQFTEMSQELSWLNMDVRQTGTERYLLARAIQKGFLPYETHCRRLFSMQDEGATAAEMYTEYDIITTISGYLQQTTRQLQSAALSDGQTALADLRVETKNQNNIFILLIILAAVILIIMVNELIQSTVVPVLRLSDASKEISSGNFDTPDVSVNSRDEIYTLAQAFNQMKDSMKHLFRAMQEKTEMEQRLYQKDLEASENRRLLEQAKMQQLRNQINPHFLFNTLNIISRTARREKAAASEKLILSLARLFRYSLKTDDTEVSLSREINIVNDYVSIQSTRFEDRVHLVWRISPALSPDQILVPAFVLQPVVENSVIHGLEPKREGGTIRIRAHLSQGVVHLIISDNGVGMDHATMQTILSQQRVRGDVSGIGIGNVRSRLFMLNPHSSFVIHSRPGRGTCVHIALPQKGPAESEACPQRLGDATEQPVQPEEKGVAQHAQK